MPAANPVTVVVAPVPEMLPGLMVHVPEAGNPLTAALPVATAHVGWVIVPMFSTVGNGFTVKVALLDVALLLPLQLVI